MRIQPLDISLRALCLLPMLALGACDPKLQLGEVFDNDLEGGDTQSSGGQTDPAEQSTGGQTDPAEQSTGAAPPESTNTDASSSTGGATDESGEPVTICDPWAQDCPDANQKCVPYDESGENVWNALKCIDIDPAPLPVGSPCLHPGSVADPSDNCEKGAICWDVDLDTKMGTCVAQCEGTPDAPICGAGTSCNIANGGVLTLCLADCDPLGQDCGQDQLCILAGDMWSCVDDGSEDQGQAFDSCEFVNSCDPGLACLTSALPIECDPEAAGCCLPLCDVSAPNTCPGADLVCASWYEDELAPPGKENLGVYRIPD